MVTRRVTVASRRLAPSLVEKREATRCPWCHGSLGRLEATWSCRACHTVQHEACVAEGGRCAVWGCRGVFRAAFAMPALVAPSSDRVWWFHPVTFWLVALVNIVCAPIGCSLAGGGWVAVVFGVHVGCMIAFAAAASALKREGKGPETES